MLNVIDYTGLYRFKVDENKRVTSGEDVFSKHMLVVRLAANAIEKHF